MDVFSNNTPIAFDNVAHLSLFKNKDRLIIRELLRGNVFGEHFNCLRV